MRLSLVLPFAVLFTLNMPAAFASPLVDNTCQGVANCNTDNSTNQTTVVAPVQTTIAGAAAEGGDAVNFNANVAKGGDVYRSGNSHVDVDNRLANKQGQFQGQDQSQHQKVEDSGNSSITWNERRDVAQAYAAGTSFGGRTCGKSAGIGAQGPGFGGALSLPFGDDVCEGLELADWLAAHGYTDKAVKILCLKDDDFADVMGEACK